MGKPKHSDDHRGEQKGAQEHAEGQHGPKAHEARKSEISDQGQQRGGASGRSERAANDPHHAGSSDADLHEKKIANPDSERDGGHRLFENRTQHDDAEKSSEHNRRDRDVQRHGHAADQFQGHDAPDGGTGRPDTVKNTGKGGGNRSREGHGGKEQV